MKVKVIINILILSIMCNFNFLYANSNNMLYELNKETIFCASSMSYINYIDEDVSKNMLNNLIQELRPFLKDVIDVKYDKNYVFTTKEAIAILIRHPIKFLSAIYNYILYSLEDTLNIASKSIDQ